MELQSLPLIPSLDKLLPLSPKILRIKIFIFILRLLFNDLIKKSFKLSPELFCSISEQKSRSIHRYLTVEETKKFCAKCKKEKTTVTGVLNAGMLVSFKKELAIKDNINLNFLLAIDLRKFIKSNFAKPHNMGFMTSSIVITSTLSSDLEFWNLARNSQQKIKKSLKINQHLYSPFFTKDRINSFRKKESNTFLFCISNMGRIDIPYTYGSLELIEIHATISNRGYTPIIISHFTTFREQLYMSFTYKEPLISSQRALSIVDSFMSLIGEIIND